VLITQFKPLNFIDAFIATGLTLVALCLYLLTLAPTVLEADSGEFQFVAWLPAIAHPTGYPLYTLLGWLWTHLFPWGEVAWRMNSFSAICAAGAVGLTYLLAVHWLALTLPATPRAAQRMAAILTAAMFAISPTFWSQAIVAEVYSLQLFLLALTLYLLARQSYLSPMLALLFGLGLTHHVTTILWLPALVAFSVLAANESTPPISQQARHLLWAILPLTLYFYLPWIAPLTPYATLQLSPSQPLVLYENTWHGFWQHLTATAFQGELQPDAVGLARLTLVATWLQQQVGWLGLGLMVMGLITLSQQKQIAILALTGLGALAVLAFNLSYFIGDVYVLFIPVWWVVCLWLGLGSLRLMHGLATQFVRGRLTVNTNLYFRPFEQRLGQRAYQIVMIGGMGLWLLLPISGLISHFNGLTQAHNTAARDRWQQILAEPLPERAILISNDRNEIMPMWYYQYVEKQRPDLQGLFPLITADPAYRNVGRVLDQALASARPVYLIKPMDGLRLKADLVATGTLFQAVAYPAPPQYPRNIRFGETMILLGYDLSAAFTSTVTITLHWQSLRLTPFDYTSYVHLLDATGAGVTQSDHLPGGDFYPTHYWQVGEILHDPHMLTLPADLAATTYDLQVGWYRQPEPNQFENLGQSEIIGTINLTR